MYKELKEALKAAVAAVKPIRERIRMTKDQERYDAWNDKRAGSDRRRTLHLALCYLRGTPYRECEAAPDTTPSASTLRDLLTEYGCTENAEQSVASWLAVAPRDQVKPTKPKTQPATHDLRLYVVVRADLPPGAQAVQAAHAMREFAAEYPRLEAAWHEKSNTLVVLAAKDERDLYEWAIHLGERMIPVAMFREPDLPCGIEALVPGGSVTAICVGPQGGWWLRSLPLALGESAA